MKRVLSVVVPLAGIVVLTVAVGAGAATAATAAAAMGSR
jgi:hypothetical protein